MIQLKNKYFIKYKINKEHNKLSKRDVNPTYCYVVVRKLWQVVIYIYNLDFNLTLTWVLKQALLYHNTDNY